jgi:lipopolysaccharide export system protein LptA
MKTLPGPIVFGVFVLFSSALFAETIIKGAKMEIINKGESMIFSGGVKMLRGDDIVESETMKTNKTRDKIFAEGNVRLFRKTSSTETWQGFGKNGYFDNQSGSAYLTGNGKQAHVIRTEILSSTSSRVTDIYADRIDIFKAKETAKAQGQVSGIGVDPDTKDKFQFNSDVADYDGKLKTLILSGSSQSTLTQTSIDAKRTI